LWVKDKEAGNMIRIKRRYTGRVIKEVDATSLVNADLRATNLRAADLQDANLLGANLQFADLWGADLRGADLRDADLRDADLRYTNSQGADLRAADLRGTGLNFAKLQDANLQNANLRNANLHRAKLQRANLQDTNLQNTNLRWVLGDGKRIKTIDDHYRIVIMLECGVMAIGCEQHSVDEWMNFSDEEIDKMDIYALYWWKTWKPRIQQLIAS
jgi:hypothetical protein